MTILDELRRIPKGNKEQRKFGLLIGGILSLLGAWFAYRGKPAAPFVLYPGLILFFCGLLFPATLRVIYLLWMALGLVLGFVVAQSALTLLFFFFITPLGLLARALGKDFLRKKLKRDATSYWIPRTPREASKPEGYLRQF